MVPAVVPRHRNFVARNRLAEDWVAGVIELPFDALA